MPTADGLKLVPVPGARSGDSRFRSCDMPAVENYSFDWKAEVKGDYPGNFGFVMPTEPPIVRRLWVGDGCVECQVAGMGPPS